MVPVSGFLAAYLAGQLSSWACGLTAQSICSGLASVSSSASFSLMLVQQQVPHCRGCAGTARKAFAALGHFAAGGLCSCTCWFGWPALAVKTLCSLTFWKWLEGVGYVLARMSGVAAPQWQMPHSRIVATCPAVPAAVKREALEEGFASLPE